MSGIFFQQILIEVIPYTTKIDVISQLT